MLDKLSYRLHFRKKTHLGASKELNLCYYICNCWSDWMRVAFGVLWEDVWWGCVPTLWEGMVWLTSMGVGWGATAQLLRDPEVKGRHESCMREPWTEGPMRSQNRTTLEPPPPLQTWPFYVHIPHPMTNPSTGLFFWKHCFDHLTLH